MVAVKFRSNIPLFNKTNLAEIRKKRNGLKTSFWSYRVSALGELGGFVLIQWLEKDKNFSLWNNFLTYLAFLFFKMLKI